MTTLGYVNYGSSSGKRVVTHATWLPALGYHNHDLPPMDLTKMRSPEPTLRHGEDDAEPTGWWKKLETPY